MGFGLSFGRNTNQVKLIRKYVKERAKEKRILNSQFKKLEDELKNKAIDQNTYERLRDVLEIIPSNKEMKLSRKLFKKSKKQNKKR